MEFLKEVGVERIDAREEDSPLGQPCRVWVGAGVDSRLKIVW